MGLYTVNSKHQHALSNTGFQAPFVGAHAQTLIDVWILLQNCNQIYKLASLTEKQNNFNPHHMREGYGTCSVIHFVHSLHY